MTSSILLFLVAAVLLFIIGRKKMMLSNSNVKNVTAEEANKLITDNKDVFILDVRTRAEFNGGHLPGAKLIPTHELASRISEIEKYKDLPVLVYCASGGRSPGAVSTLLSNNFHDIYHMNRGISSWTYRIKI